MEALSTTLSTRQALYIGLGLLAATLAIKGVALALYNRLIFYLKMAVVTGFVKLHADAERGYIRSDCEISDTIWLQLN